MKLAWPLSVLLLGGIALPAFAQTQSISNAPVSAATTSLDAKAKSDVDMVKKAGDWVASLKLNDPAKEARVTEVIATHLKDRKSVV